MAWWGTFIGGTLGYVFGGPLGAIIGAALGGNLDRGIKMGCLLYTSPSPRDRS